MMMMMMMMMISRKVNVITRLEFEFAYCLVQSTGAAEYTDCIAERGKTFPMSVLNMTLSNLMVSLQ